MYITEQIWKGIVVQCNCGMSFFITPYQPVTQCESCGQGHSTVALLAVWFGIDKARLRRQVDQVAA